MYVLLTHYLLRNHYSPYHQGDSPDFFYIIVAGGIRIVDEDDGQVTSIHGAGQGFGGIELQSGKARLRGARAGPDAQLLLIDYDTYSRYLMERAAERVRQAADDIWQMAARVWDIDESTLLTIAALSTREVFPMDQLMHTQSPESQTEPQHIFCICKGTAELVVCRTDDRSGRSTRVPPGGLRVASIMCGQITGDVAAFSPWAPKELGLALHVRGATEVEVLKIPVKELRSHLPPSTLTALHSLADKRARQQQQQLRALLSAQPAKHAAVPRDPVDSPLGFEEWRAGLSDLGQLGFLDPHCAEMQMMSSPKSRQT